MRDRDERGLTNPVYKPKVKNRKPITCLKK